MRKTTVAVMMLLLVTMVMLLATVVFSNDGDKEIEEARESHDIVLVDFWAEVDSVLQEKGVLP